jgi:hypothetical protein
MIDQFRDEMIRPASDSKGFEQPQKRSPSAFRNLSGLICCCLASCGGNIVHTTQSVPQTTSNIQAPTAIKLYPVGYTVNPRIFVMVTPGTAPVSLPLAFDTGSSGITLNALSVFPPSMVTATGFIFPARESSITYNGIIVTNQQGSRVYGGLAGRTKIGNIGFARITFGDTAAQLTTDVMPILFYYSVMETATQMPAATQPQQGWFGVNSAPGAIEVAKSVAPSTGFPACSQETTGTCRVVSVLKYLDYSSGVDAGFSLSPATLKQCDVTSAGSCIPQSLLTVGLTGAMEAGFSTITLPCPPPEYLGPDSIQGYSVCQSNIPGSTATIAGSVSASLNESPLFDTGNPANALAQASGALSSPVPPNTLITLTTPSGFVYSYVTAASGITETGIGPTISTGVGINFFTEHSFFIDFVGNTEGWK